MTRNEILEVLLGYSRRYGPQRLIYLILIGIVAFGMLSRNESSSSKIVFTLIFGALLVFIIYINEKTVIFHDHNDGFTIKHLLHTRQYRYDEVTAIKYNKYFRSIRIYVNNKSVYFNSADGIDTPINMLVILALYSKNAVISKFITDEIEKVENGIVKLA